MHGTCWSLSWKKVLEDELRFLEYRVSVVAFSSDKPRYVLEKCKAEGSEFIRP